MIQKPVHPFPRGLCAGMPEAMQRLDSVLYPKDPALWGVMQVIHIRADGSVRCVVDPVDDLPVLVQRIELFWPEELVLADHASPNMLATASGSTG